MQNNPIKSLNFIKGIKREKNSVFLIFIADEYSLTDQTEEITDSAFKKDINFEFG